MIPDKLIDVEHKWDGLQSNPTEQEMLGAGAKPFPDSMRIPRSEWRDRIQEHEQNHSSADFYSGRFTAQKNSHECVAHAAHQAFMIARNRQHNGLEQDVWFSPLALYTRITNGRRWGGSSVTDSMYEMIEHGMIPDHDGPGGNNSQTKLFLHTLHETSGRTENWWPTSGWVRPSELPDGWKNTAKHFRALEVFTVPDREAHASCLLHGLCVVNGRLGHSVPHVKMVFDNNRFLSCYKDSYRIYRYDSERLWDSGGYVIRSTTTSENVPHEI